MKKISSKYNPESKFVRSSFWGFLRNLPVNWYGQDFVLSSPRGTKIAPYSLARSCKTLIPHILTRVFIFRGVLLLELLGYGQILLMSNHIITVQFQAAWSVGGSSGNCPPRDPHLACTAFNKLNSQRQYTKQYLGLGWKKIILFVTDYENKNNLETCCLLGLPKQNPQYDKWSRRSKLVDMVIISDFHSGHKNATEHLIGVASFAPSRLDRGPATRWFDDRSTTRESINCQLPPFPSSEQCFMKILMEIFFLGETSLCHFKLDICQFSKHQECLPTICIFCR